MIKTKYQFVVIGASIAGLSAAFTAARLLAPGQVLLINGEDRMPYKRTKLTKHITTGFIPNQFQLYQNCDFEQAGIDYLQQKVRSLQPESRFIELENHSTIRFQKVLLATGSVANHPPPITGGNKHIYSARTASATEYLMQGTRSKRELMVIGAGVEGCEIADQLIKLNKKITLIDSGQGPIPKWLNNAQQIRLIRKIRAAGVQYHLNTRVKQIRQTASGLLQVDTTTMPFTTQGIVLAIGARPNLFLAQKAGLETEHGILVNTHLQTSHPAVYAAGDGAQHPGNLITGLWHAAEYQGILAAQNCWGQKTPFDQRAFRLKTEIFGDYYFSMNLPKYHPNPAYATQVHQEGNKYQCFYFHDDQLHAVAMQNDQENAKMYEKAIREHWDVMQVNRRLSLNSILKDPLIDEK